MAIPGFRINPIQVKRKEFKIDTVLGIVCEYYGVEKSEVMRHNRKRQLVVPRHVTMWFLSKYTDTTKTDIGKFFKMDHSTVIHAENTISDLMQTSSDIKNDVEQLRSRISDYLNPI